MTKEASLKYAQSEKGKLKQKEYAEANKARVRAYHAEWVKKNKEKAAAYVRNWREKNREKATAQILRYQRANPEKVKAYRKFRKALKQGILVRPDACQRCGKAEKVDAHHHNGYDKPLDVLWLCRQCHVDEHPNR